LPFISGPHCFRAFPFFHEEKKMPIMAAWSGSAGADFCPISPLQGIVTDYSRKNFSRSA